MLYHPGWAARLFYFRPSRWRHDDSRGEFGNDHVYTEAEEEEEEEEDEERKSDARSPSRRNSGSISGRRGGSSRSKAADMFRLDDEHDLASQRLKVMDVFRQDDQDIDENARDMANVKLTVGACKALTKLVKVNNRAIAFLVHTISDLATVAFARNAVDELEEEPASEPLVKNVAEMIKDEQVMKEVVTSIKEIMIIHQNASNALLENVKASNSEETKKTISVIAKNTNAVVALAAHMPRIHAGEVHLQKLASQRLEPMLYNLQIAVKSFELFKRFDLPARVAAPVVRHAPKTATVDEILDKMEEVVQVISATLEHSAQVKRQRQIQEVLDVAIESVLLCDALYSSQLLPAPAVSVQQVVTQLKHTTKEQRGRLFDHVKGIQHTLQDTQREVVSSKTRCLTPEFYDNLRSVSRTVVQLGQGILAFVNANKTKKRLAQLTDELNQVVEEKDDSLDTSEAIEVLKGINEAIAITERLPVAARASGAGVAAAAAAPLPIVEPVLDPRLRPVPSDQEEKTEDMINLYWKMNNLAANDMRFVTVNPLTKDMEVTIVLNLYLFVRFMKVLAGTMDCEWSKLLSLDALLSLPTLYSELLHATDKQGLGENRLNLFLAEASSAYALPTEFNARMRSLRDFLLRRRDALMNKLQRIPLDDFNVDHVEMLLTKDGYAMIKQPLEMLCRSPKYSKFTFGMFIQSKTAMPVFARFCHLYHTTSPPLSKSSGKNNLDYMKGRYTDIAAYFNSCVLLNNPRRIILDVIEVEQPGKDGHKKRYHVNEYWA